MAGFTERSGSIRVRVRIDGGYKTATFPTRALAKKWADKMESEGKALRVAKRLAQAGVPEGDFRPICVCIQLDPNIKAQVEDALDGMGVSAEDAFRLLLLRIADERRLPFEVRAPQINSNKEA